MAMLNGPAIKNEVMEELLKSVSKPEDLLGSEAGCCKHDMAASTIVALSSLDAMPFLLRQIPIPLKCI